MFAELWWLIAVVQESCAPVRARRRRFTAPTQSARHACACGVCFAPFMQLPTMIVSVVLARARQASEDVCQQWKSMPFHSVGPATAKTLAACGFQPSGASLRSRGQCVRSSGRVERNLIDPWLLLAVFEDAQSSLLLGKRLAELYKSATKELLVLVGDRCVTFQCLAPLLADVVVVP